MAAAVSPAADPAVHPAAGVRREAAGPPAAVASPAAVPHRAEVHPRDAVHLPGEVRLPEAVLSLAAPAAVPGNIQHLLPTIRRIPAAAAAVPSADQRHKTTAAGRAMAVMAAVMDITMVIPTAGPVYSADYFSAGDMVITTTRMSAM